mgnify:CR=1 FL=1|jgi:hypothetical protein
MNSAYVVRLTFLCACYFIVKSEEKSREEGIRTLDTLPYTHFPGVRLRPLGHLSLF